MTLHPSTEDLRKTFDYVDGCFYWKIKPAISVHIGSKAGSLHKPSGYMQVSFKNKRYLLHRLIWLWHGFTLDENQEIDHINRNRLDNRIENLRQVNRCENRKNRHANFVYYHKETKKWRAYTSRTDSKNKKYIGYYETKAEALKAVEEFYGR